METRIGKLNLPGPSILPFRFPDRHSLLDIQADGEFAVIFYAYTYEAQAEFTYERTFVPIATGQPVPNPQLLDYLTTIQVPGRGRHEGTWTIFEQLAQVGPNPHPIGWAKLLGKPLRP